MTIYDLYPAWVCLLWHPCKLYKNLKRSLFDSLIHFEQDWSYNADVFNRLQKLAESEEGAEIPEEVEDVDDDEPEPETLKYANRSGSYSLCAKAGIGNILLF